MRCVHTASCRLLGVVRGVVGPLGVLDDEVEVGPGGVAADVALLVGGRRVLPGAPTTFARQKPQLSAELCFRGHSDVDS